MSFKHVTIFTSIVLILISGCSVIDNVIYHPDIKQGNLFSLKEISRIQVGMTQNQVIYILGNPMMKDPFGTNTWFYVFYQKNSNREKKQKTLTLTFNNKGYLTKIENISSFK